MNDTAMEDLLWSLFGFCMAMGLYFLPAIYAGLNRRRQLTAIVLVNVLLGWTLIGWIVALVWAAIEDKPASNEPRADPEPAPTDPNRYHHRTPQGDPPLV